MPAYQLLEPGRVYFTLTGLEIAAGGSLTFYLPGTTTLSDTWSDSDLTTLNSNPVVLDSSGRSAVEIWGSAAYDVLLKDADGATVWTRGVAPQVQEGGTIPALQTGEFLTNDGTNLSWQPISEVPDTSGSEGYILSVAGGAAQWIPFPEPAEPEVVVTADDFRAGTSSDATKFYIQTGTGSAPATGTVNTNSTVTFGTAFSTTPKVFVQPTSDSNAGGPMVAEISAGPSTTGFTVLFTIAAGSLSSAVTLNAVPFNWVAIGTIEVP